jgi:hypothetical protein
LSGYSGYSGSGVSGYSGYSGESGYSGSGISGYSGYSGSGISGYSGVYGKSGYSGSSGYSGVYGKSGYSGTSGYNNVQVVIHCPYGYCMGGNAGGAISIIDRITFPFDSGRIISASITSTVVGTNSTGLAVGASIFKNNTKISHLCTAFL